MGALEIILAVIGALVLLLLLLYLLVGIRPKRRGCRLSPTLSCDYAHRGVHGNGIPENSLAAFERACEAGVGIELDVQLSRDGEVMVFHDYTLNRMTGKDARLCELDAAELAMLSLDGTDQHIPTLRQVLSLVNGRVPLLVELKGESLDDTLCPKLADLLAGYTGDYCMESFNPLLVRQMHKLMPHVPCGLLYTNVCRDKKKHSLLNIALTLMALNFLTKPDFIAYNKLDRHALPVGITTRMYRAPRFVWTVKTEEELNDARKNGESPIFEGLPSIPQR